MPKKIIIHMVMGLLLAMTISSFAEDLGPTESPQPPNLHGQVYYGPDYTTGYSSKVVQGGWGTNDPYEGGPYNWGGTQVWVPGHTVLRGTHTEIVPAHWEYR
ncbi:hypothetical protein BH10PSE19_BH10PSE19_01190 [soil metagenome]